MSCIHYKFKSSMDYDTLTFDGLHISLADLKKAIIDHKKLGKSGDFHLQITDAQTKQAYVVDSELIPRNASVIVTRVPIGGTSIKSKIVEDALKNAALKQPAYWPVPVCKEVESFGKSGDKSGALLSSKSFSANNNQSEDDKIAMMMKQSTRDYDPSNYVKPKGPVGKPHAGYTCYRCGKTGHFIQNCPSTQTEGDAEVVKRPSRYAGIPKDFLSVVPGNAPGARLTSQGIYAVPTIDKEAFAKGKKEKPPFVPQEEAQGLIEEEEKIPIPGELICPICKGLLKDAVVIPCCGTSFCDECVRTALMSSEDHVCPMEGCGETDVAPNSLIPNKFLRTAVVNFLNETGYAQIQKKVKTERENSPVVNTSSHQDSPEPPPKELVPPTLKKAPSRPTLPDIMIPLDLVGLPPQVIQAKLREREMEVKGQDHITETTDSEDRQKQETRSPSWLIDQPGTPTTPVYDDNPSDGSVDLFPEPPKYIGPNSKESSKTDQPSSGSANKSISQAQQPTSAVNHSDSKLPTHSQVNSVQPPTQPPKAVPSGHPYPPQLHPPGQQPLPGSLPHQQQQPGAQVHPPANQNALPPGITRLPPPGMNTAPPGVRAPHLIQQQHRPYTAPQGMPAQPRPGVPPNVQPQPGPGYPQLQGLPPNIPGHPGMHLPPPMHNPQALAQQVPPLAGQLPNVNRPPPAHPGMAPRLPTQVGGYRGPQPGPPGVVPHPAHPVPRQPPPSMGSKVLSEEEFYRMQRRLKEKERPHSARRQVSYEEYRQSLKKENPPKEKKKDAIDEFISGLEKRDQADKDKKKGEKPAKTDNSESKETKSGGRSRSRTPSDKSDSLQKKGSLSPRRRKSRSMTPVRGGPRTPLRDRTNSRTPPPRRGKSRSPMRRGSPFRRGSRTPPRRFSRSPARWNSRSPAGRKLSRSPRRMSRSPGRKFSRSPGRWRSLSPGGRKLSRSPGRGPMRSPGRGSRSPGRRWSRSPVRRGSRSPFRRMSRSPRNRSPMRRRRSFSFSPSRRSFSRSPFNGRRSYSRGPPPLKGSRRSFSRTPPYRSFSRSPRRRGRRSRSFTPKRRFSRSPGFVRKRSFSRSPSRGRRRFSRSPKRRPFSRSPSPRRRMSRSPRFRRKSYSRSPPPRKRSRTPRRRSFSRSPKRLVRSPALGRKTAGRPKSKTPERKLTRSPVRKISPKRMRSKSPFKNNKKSVSPRPKSKTPVPKASTPPRDPIKSPVKRKSPSPEKQKPTLAPPVKEKSKTKSPERKIPVLVHQTQKSPIRKKSNSPPRRKSPPKRKRSPFAKRKSLSPHRMPMKRSRSKSPRRRPLSPYSKRRRSPYGGRRMRRSPSPYRAASPYNGPPAVWPVQGQHPPPGGPPYQQPYPDYYDERLGYPPTSGYPQPGPGGPGFPPAPQQHNYGRHPPPPGTEEDYAPPVDPYNIPPDRRGLPAEWIKWYQDLQEYSERLNQYASVKNSNPDTRSHLERLGSMSSEGLSPSPPRRGRSRSRTPPRRKRGGGREGEQKYGRSRGHSSREQRGDRNKDRDAQKSEREPPKYRDGNNDKKVEKERDKEEKTKEVVRVEKVEQSKNKEPTETEKVSDGSKEQKPKKKKKDKEGKEKRKKEKKEKKKDKIKKEKHKKSKHKEQSETNSVKMEEKQEEEVESKPEEQEVSGEGKEDVKEDTVVLELDTGEELMGLDEAGVRHGETAVQQEEVKNVIHKEIDRKEKEEKNSDTKEMVKEIQVENANEKQQKQETEDVEDKQVANQRTEEVSVQGESPTKKKAFKNKSIWSSRTASAATDMPANTGKDSEGSSDHTKPVQDESEAKDIKDDFQQKQSEEKAEAVTTEGSVSALADKTIDKPEEKEHRVEQEPNKTASSIEDNRIVKQGSEKRRDSARSVREALMAVKSPRESSGKSPRDGEKKILSVASRIERRTSDDVMVKPPEMSKWERSDDTDSEEEDWPVRDRKEEKKGLPRSVIESAAHHLASKSMRGAIMPVTAPAQKANRRVFIDSDNPSSERKVSKKPSSSGMSVTIASAPLVLTVKDRLGKRMDSYEDEQPRPTQSVKDRLGKKVDSQRREGGSNPTGTNTGKRAIKLNRDFNRDGRRDSDRDRYESRDSNRNTERRSERDYGRRDWGSRKDSNRRDYAEGERWEKSDDRSKRDYDRQNQVKRDSRKERTKEIRNSLDGPSKTDSSVQEESSSAKLATSKSKSGKSSSTKLSKFDRKISIADESVFEPDYEEDDLDHNNEGTLTPGNSLDSDSSFESGSKSPASRKRRRSSSNSGDSGKTKNSKKKHKKHKKLKKNKKPKD